MRKFENAEVEVVLFSMADIITTSTTPTETQDPDEGELD